MSVYIVIHGQSGPWHVVRSTDWLILATCEDGAVANQIASLMNQYAA